MRWFRFCSGATPGSAIAGIAVIVLALLFWLVAALGSVTAVHAQADLSVYNQCLVSPNPQCLLDLAQMERDEFWRTSPDEAEFGQGRWLERVARVELAARDVERAARHLAEMEPGDLRWFALGGHIEYPEEWSRIDSEARIRGALEARLAKEIESPKFPHLAFIHRAEIAIAMFGLGYEQRATDVVRQAIDDFGNALVAGQKVVVFAAPDLMEAATIIKAEVPTAHLVEILSAPGVAGEGYPQDAGWAVDRALMVFRNANIARPSIADSTNTSLRFVPPDQLEAALQIALSGDLEKLGAYIGGLRLSDDPGTRDVQIRLIFDHLMERLLDNDRPDLVVAYAMEFPQSERDAYLMSAANYYVERGQVSETESLLGRVSDKGVLVALLIRLAKQQTAQGNRELATELLNRAADNLSKESDPALQVLLNIDIGSARAGLGDAAGAKIAIETGMQSIREVSDPFLPQPDYELQFEAAIRAATVLSLIGEEAEGLSHIKAALPEDDPGSFIFGAIRTAKALTEEGRSDLARQLIDHVLSASFRRKGIDHEDWSFLYLEAADALIVPN